jgi:hypothetical protein
MIPNLIASSAPLLAIGMASIVVHFIMHSE